MTRGEFITQMLELGAEVDKATGPLQISMAINDAEILYDKHMEDLRPVCADELGVDPNDFE